MLLELCIVSGGRKLGHKQTVQGLVKAWNWSGFMSEKGGNYVTNGCFRDWRKAFVVVAGREGRASRLGEGHHDVKRRWNPHSLVLC